MITRADVANVHHRLLSERLRLRHALLEITTVEPLIWRGARVCLRKQANVASSSPHYLYYFAIIIGGETWKSAAWKVLMEPTRASRHQTKARYHVAVTETISYMLAMVEREPERCHNCDAVLKVDSATARFCCYACQHERANRLRSRK